MFSARILYSTESGFSVGWASRMYISRTVRAVKTTDRRAASKPRKAQHEAALPAESAAQDLNYFVTTSDAVAVRVRLPLVPVTVSV
jgi:hypothetical protein